MIFRCAAVLVPLVFIGCAVQSDSQPAPQADNTAASAANVAEPAETTQAKSDGPQAPENGTVDAQAVSTETIVMKVPGMH